MKLRAHHVLCIHGFQGHGYSPGFVKNMERVVNELNANPRRIVEFVEGTDVICAACPFNIEERCTREGEESEGLVRRRDEKMQDLLGVRVGSRISISLVKRLIGERLEPQIIEDLCQSCQWFPLGYCQEGLAELQQSD